MYHWISVFMYLCIYVSIYGCIHIYIHIYIFDTPTSYSAAYAILQLAGPRTLENRFSNLKKPHVPILSPCAVNPRMNVRSLLTTSAIFIGIFYERDLTIYRRIDSATKGCEVSQFSREFSCGINASFASRTLVEKLRLCSWEGAGEGEVVVGIWEYARGDEGTRRCTSECEGVNISVHLHMCKVCIYMHMYIFTYMYINTYMYICVYIWINIYMHINIFMYMHVYVCVYIYVSMYIYIYVYAYVYVYMYAFM